MIIQPHSYCQTKHVNDLTLAEIELATNNFDEALVIGSGGFGNVYKSLSKFGLVYEVAIKRLHSTSNQGASEFEAEVMLLSKLRHGNLVPLIGYCSEGKEMALAYEFMPNGTLKDHLHKGDMELSWLQLLKICIGAARGLDYLHTGTSTQHGVIHRDVKTSNILLDSNFAAKISDFGLAKIGTINQTRTHVSTLVKGTFGYIDPCYFYTGKLTRKTDVYAFGVVLFEVLSGKHAVDPTLDDSLADWAKDHIKQGRHDEIINHRLMGQISKKCLKGFTRIAVQCLHNQPKQRPTMAEVVVKLESILSRERENVGSSVDDGRFINKVRYFFRGKADLMQAQAEGSGSKVSAQYNQKSINFSVGTFTYAEILSATNNFNDKQLSTYSDETIYKGWVDELTYAPTESGVGLAMYVRRRHIGTSELDIKPEEFNHPNLVKLLGYCLYNQELSSVYELTLDTSLDKLLFGEPGAASLSWFARLEIAVGAAKGLSFLHKRGHPAFNQFKTACILVDADYNARLRDFEVDDSFVDLGSYSFILDAPYAAPEWFRYQADVKFDGTIVAHHCAAGKFCFQTYCFRYILITNDHRLLKTSYQWLTLNGHMVGFGVKSEIYSFGVVLLEILTGMKVFDWNRPEGKQNLVKWVTPLLADEVNLEKILDRQLQDHNHPPKGAYKLALLASKCLQPKQSDRPSMEEIVQVLCECDLEQYFDT
ncbi:hypothetical protein SSX86_012664 [Deinandra increscens subsp. villosa]|uniref:non-specific serine/threonine protein kinase n=1 Tax=Deinandra increscens subsp. villosa TaxID=3103831 RepID=A0AAP0H147_9ASTR